MTTHELKTWPAYFRATADGEKTVEVRRNDRPFARGDVLVLLEYEPSQRSYSGRRLTRMVTEVHDLAPIGLPGFVAMAVREVPGRWMARP